MYERNSGWGVVYVAYGERAKKEAFRSITTLRVKNPDVPVTVFTDDQSFRSLHLVSVVTIAEPLSPFKIKPISLRQSPYERTIYLDCDTYPIDNISELAEKLGEADILVANSPRANNKVRPREFIDFKDRKSYNTGVLAVNMGSTVRSFLEMWSDRINGIHDDDLRPGYGDQLHFNNLIKEGALKSLSVRMEVIDNNIYNARWLALPALRESGLLENVKIVHTHEPAGSVRYSFPEFNYILDSAGL